MKGNAGASIPAIAVPIAAIATHNADANLPKVDTIPVNAPLIPLVTPPPLAPPAAPPLRPPPIRPPPQDIRLR